MSFRHGRHAAAYILLALTQGPSYGLEILAFLGRSLPFCNFDTASVYRTLQALEKQKAVESYWEGDRGGAPRKWYRLTEEGERMLDEFEADIRLRHANLSFFLEFRGRQRKEGKP
ncbi:MAG: PadR family transcriptional regulator [Geobacter sp.]|nr:PadR family transcriptional regulator [Geobacter sp.]